MQHDVLKAKLSRAAALATMAAIGLVAAAQPASAEDDMTSLSYIAYVERYATVQTAMQDETLEAVMNMPLVPGDRLDTARQARLEIRLADGSNIWLDQYSALALDAVAFSRGTDDPRTVLFLADGSAIVAIPESSLVQEPTRVDGPGATVYLNGPGWFRLEALRSNTMRIEVWEGAAEVLTGTGTVQVRTGSSAEIADHQVVRTESYLTRGDDFGRWVMDRVQPADQGDSARHIDNRHARQGAVLDNYGTWVYIDNRDLWAWQPTVAATWRPYTHGRWYWTHTGWSWISYEPWGWLPHHYGTWFFDARHGGWLWLWGDYWGPAWVSWMWWDGWVGWCPRGWYDFWYWDRWHRPWPGGGHAGPRPPRSHTMPPADGGGDSRQPVRTTRDGDERRPTPGRLALEVSGSARLDQVDGRGWNVVAASDFGGNHLARRVRPASEVIGNAPADARAVVASGPLVTAPPQGGSASRHLERTFRQVDSSVDVSPLLARSDDLAADDIARVATPTDAASLGRRAQLEGPLAVTQPERAQAAARESRRAPSASSRAPSRSAASAASPNIHRPTERTGVTDRAPLSSPPARRSGSLLGGDAFGRSTPPRTISPPSGARQGSPSPVVPRSGGRIAPPSSGTVTAPGSRTVTPPSSFRSPSSAPRPVLRPSSPSLRSPSGRTGGSTTIRRPSSSSASRPSVRPRSSSSSSSSRSVRPRSSSSSSSRPSVSPRSSSGSSGSMRSTPRSSSSSSSSSSSGSRRPSRPRG